MDKCEVCGVEVCELRRGRCLACYNRWASARPVGFGASCRLCGDRRRSQLRSIELLGRWTPVCHACAAAVSSLDPAPGSLGDLREALRRGPRRAADHRRAVRLGAGTGAVPRRDSQCEDSEDSAMVDDDDMILEIAELASELESLAEDLGEVADLTRIHEFNR